MNGWKAQRVIWAGLKQLTFLFLLTLLPENKQKKEMSFISLQTRDETSSTSILITLTFQF